MDAPVQTIMETARRVLPAASFGNLAGDIVIREGHAGHVRDIDNREYLDFLLGSGPMFVGHGHPEVVEAVREQLAAASPFSPTTNTASAWRLNWSMRWPAPNRSASSSSGTEADAFAMRVARAFRNRDKILKFEGGFHGMGDHSLMSCTPKRLGNFPQAEPIRPASAAACATTC